MKRALTKKQHAQLKGYAAMKDENGKKCFTDDELSKIFKVHRLTIREYVKRPLSYEPRKSGRNKQVKK